MYVKPIFLYFRGSLENTNMPCEWYQLLKIFIFVSKRCVTA